MIIDRRRLLHLLPATGLAVLTGCDESAEQRLERVQQTVQNAKTSLKQEPVSLAPEPTPEEKAAEDEAKPLILFCAANLGEPFLRSQSDLMRAAVRTLEGYRYKVLDGAGAEEIQLEQLGKARSEHPAWLLLSPVQVRLSAASVEAMRSAGTKVIGLDQRLPDSACDVRVYCDQAKLGRLAGQVVLDALKRKAADEAKAQVTGRVVQIRGREQDDACKVRSEAFIKVLKAEPGIMVVHDAPGDWTLEGGKARTEEARHLQGEFDVVFAHNDLMAEGASQALVAAQARERVLLVGIDGNSGRNGGIDLLRRGVIDATIWQPMPLEFAFFVIQNSINDPVFKPQASYEWEPQAVTPQTLDDFTRRQRGR